MRRFALLAPFFVIGSQASPRPANDYNSSSAALSSSTISSSTWSSSSFKPQSSLQNVQVAPSSSIVLQSNATSASSSPSSHSLSSIFVPPSTPSPSPTSSLSHLTTTARTTSSSLRLMTLSRSFNKDNATRLITPSSKYYGNATATRPCTGCVIEAYNPITTFFNVTDANNPWTSVVVTETIVTQYITYIDGTTIDTIVTEQKTVNQTKTVMGTMNQTITHSTPRFRIEPVPGTYLTVDAGPTYVIYRDLYGALDRTLSSRPSALPQTQTVCAAQPTQLKNWEPVRSEDWSYFVQTFAERPPQASITQAPVPLPSAILSYLRQNLAILSQFNGSDIATCTLRPTHGVDGDPQRTMSVRPPPIISYVTGTAAPYPGTTAPVGIAPSSQSKVTSTFLSTTYESTSSHVTRAGCLRCQDTQPPPAPTPDDSVSNKINNGDDPTPVDDPNVPQPTPIDNQRNPSDRVITIGDGTYTARPIQPTYNPDAPSDQNQTPAGVVVGSQTLTQGQSTVINGVPVVVPSDGGGTRIVVGGTTVAVNNGPTAAPVLTVGSNTITANPQGQFLVGTETLKPGGPAITIGGTTLSLGPGGTIAIVNGVTQTLANVAVITGAPAITVGGRVVTATVVGGTTQFVLGDKTLLPGNAVVVDGTTYSMPADGRGSAIVVNGVTTSLVPGKASITATVKDGTTAFVFSPSQTLTPGGVLTISGTTFSMPASASGSVIVINGVTSTLGKGPVTAAAALTIDGKTYSAVVRDGTTEFVLGPGTTLRPGESVIVSGTTYSLDSQGTALVINGKTSTIPRLPASNSASTTASPNSSSTSRRDVGNFVWSGIGGKGGGSSSSKAGAYAISPPRGVDKWIESCVIGIAGWVLMAA